MKKVSIIVPVYNNEEYLADCLNRLVSQTYKSVEIIIVDNNSTDGSYALCSEYAKNNPNIILHRFTDASGPSAARNAGLSYATGYYICFCDADDQYDLTMVEKTVNLAEQTGADYVIADMYSERISSKLGLPWKNGTVFDAEQIKNDMIPQYIGNISDNDKTLPVWGSVIKCLFKKSIIDENNIKFPQDLRFAEDLVFTLRYLSNAQKAAVTDEVLYRYRYNKNSLMNSYNVYQPNMPQSHFDLLCEIKKIMQQLQIYESNKKRLNTTARAYIKECVGNAAKKQPDRSFFDCYREICQTVTNDISRAAFEKFDSKDRKNKAVYCLIKNRQAFLLTLYYRIRSGVK